MELPRDVHQALERDKVLAPFADGGVDVEEYAARCLREGDKTDVVERLQAGIARLDAELREEVVANQGALLQQSSHIRQLDQLLATIRANVRALQTSLGKINASITEPVNKFKERTLQFERILQATEILRQVIRFFYLRRRLDAQCKGGARDLPKAAVTLQELETLAGSPKLQAVHVVGRERAFIAQTGKDIRGHAMHALRQGMQSQTQTEVGSALLVFANLKELESSVHAALHKVLDQAKGVMRNALDLSTFDDGTGDSGSSKGGKGGKGGKGKGKKDGGAVPGGAQRAGMPPQGQMAAWRVQLWARMETMLNALSGLCLQVWHLQRVLGKKRDPATYQLLSAGVEDAGTIALGFWKNLTAALGAQLDKSATTSPFLNQTFITEYPKLLLSLDEFLTQLQQRITSKSRVGSPGQAERNLVLLAVRRFENAFLASSFSRLSNPVHALFPAQTAGGTSSRAVATTPIDIMAFVTTIQNELTNVRRDPSLLVAVTRNVAKAIRLFQNKCESAIQTGPDALVVSSAQDVTPSQKRNANVCNSLVQLQEAVTKLCQSYPNGSEVLLPAVKAVDQTMEEGVLHSLFTAITKHLGRVVMEMHNEDFGGRQRVPNEMAEAQQTSRYLKTLEKEVHHLHYKRLKKFSANPVLANKQRTLVESVLRMFVRHASLVRPLTETGKLRLTADMTQLELILAPLVRSLPDLGAPYLELRALRPLLFMETAEIAAMPDTLDNLQRITMVHHLFSRAKKELPSPHTAQDWTLAKYSGWLDKHSDAEAWQLIQGGLTKYAELIELRGQAQFDEVYPMLLKVGQTIK